MLKELCARSNIPSVKLRRLSHFTLESTRDGSGPQLPAAPSLPCIPRLLPSGGASKPLRHPLRAPALAAHSSFWNRPQRYSRAVGAEWYAHGPASAQTQTQDSPRMGSVRAYPCATSGVKLVQVGSSLNHLNAPVH
jgi:hypothetical protein